MKRNVGKRHPLRAVMEECSLFQAFPVLPRFPQIHHQITVIMLLYPQTFPTSLEKKFNLISQLELIASPSAKRG